MSQLVDRAIAAARALSRCAEAAVDRAHVLVTNGKLTRAQYADAYAQYLATLQKAAEIESAVTHVLAEGLPGDLAAIDAATKQLDEAGAKVQLAEDVVVILSRLVVAAGAVALAVADPSKVSLGATAAAVADAAGAIVAQVQHASGGGKGDGGDAA